MVVANDTWLTRLEGALNDVDVVRRKAGIAEAVRRRSRLLVAALCTVSTLLAHGLTIPSARHITNARRLEVFEFALPPLLRTRIAGAGPASVASEVSLSASLTVCEITVSGIWSVEVAAAAATGATGFAPFTGFRDLVL
jgi:hypothetical protein